MRTVSFSEQSASRPAGRPERAHDAGRDDGNSTDGGASHGGDGITNASHSRAQHGGGMRVHHSLAQRTQQRENSANEPRRGVQPFLRASPPHPARDGSARGVAPSTVRHNDQLQASRYDDAGFVTLGRPPPSAIRSRRAGASDPAGGGSDSTVAAPRSSAPPALTAGGATPDTHDVHNATPRATPLGTSRTHTTQTACLMRQPADTRWNYQRTRQPV